MKKKVFLIIAYMLISSYSCADENKYFPLKIGSNWIYDYQEIDYQGQVENDIIIELVSGKKTFNEREYFEVKEGNKITYCRVYNNIVYIGGYLFGDREVINDIEEVSLKLDNSKKNIEVINERVEESFKSLGFESIDVPAGSFVDCLKGEITVSLKQTDGMIIKIINTIWCAENIGVVQSIGVEFRDNKYICTKSKKLKSFIIP